MQESFFFVRESPIPLWRASLRRWCGEAVDPPRERPVGQLVRSLLGSITRDAVSSAAFRALKQRYGRAEALADADPKEVERIIAPVRSSDRKAGWLVAAVRQLRGEFPDLNLDFLAAWPISHSVTWLEQLPGVGPKVAAAMLNFSTLRLPVFVADTHVLRVLGRLGLVAANAGARRANEAVTSAMPGWTADDFRSFHVQLKYLGQTVCRWDEPDCTVCPLASHCETARRKGLI